MSDLAIHLLGRPRVERGGAAVPAPRGHKAWGVLAYLLLADRPPSRDELASLLFAEADDPQAALRWNLSALRRLLGDVRLHGDPIALSLPPGAFVDVREPDGGGVGRELLQGMYFSSSPAFEIWLATERRHLAGAAEAVLRESALTRLASGDASGAADLAARLVQSDPLDEGHQVLLIRSLATAGDGIGASRQAARCTELFRRELGIEPSPAVAEAARTVTAAPTAGPVGGRAAARAQLEAGDAAIVAGALDAGLQCLRRAVADARSVGDPELEAAALLALGSALVHVSRGRDEEAATALHETLAVAERHGLDSAAAAAARELGYVEFLQARYERAEAWFARGLRLAVLDPAERGRIGSVLGSVRSDTAHYARAADTLAEACDLSEGAGDGRRLAYSLSMLGRVQLLTGELDAAAATLDASLARMRRESWAAFAPWPEALRGDVDVARGDLEAALPRYEHAFALGCQVGDACWEGMGARGIGIVRVRSGRVEEGVEVLLDARRRAVRLPDSYLWVEGYTLDALCEVGVAHDLPAASGWVDDLTALAGRTGMRELAARAHLHRARLGDPSALTAARVLAASIDNPVLAASLSSVVVAA